MYDRKKLVERIYLNGYSQGSLARKIKMSEALFTYKLKHPTSFKVSEVQMIGYLLGMTGPEIYNMFIAGEVHGLDD